VLQIYRSILERCVLKPEMTRKESRSCPMSIVKTRGAIRRDTRELEALLPALEKLQTHSDREEICIQAMEKMTLFH
jgi:hypothetical protein